MIHTRRVIVVEGKYDRAKLAALTDACVITTDGFNLRRDAEKQRLLKRLAREFGLVLLTDSDAAGFAIRRYVEQLAGRDRVLHAYIPDIEGKERRKQRPSAEGTLGVEGVPTELLREALTAALSADSGRGGVDSGRGGGEPADNAVTSADLYADGLSGCADSAARKREFLRAAGLPARLSAKDALTLINRLLGREGYAALLAKLRGEGEDDGET